MGFKQIGEFRAFFNLANASANLSQPKYRPDDARKATRKASAMFQIFRRHPASCRDLASWLGVGVNSHLQALLVIIFYFFICSDLSICFWIVSALIFLEVPTKYEGGHKLSFFKNIFNCSNFTKNLRAETPFRILTALEIDIGGGKLTKRCK
jgi:hypothetical protein